MKWTKEEITVLKDNYSKISVEELSKLIPNHTIKSITIKAFRLNLVNKYIWSTEENLLLQEMYSHESITDLLKALPNRTYDAIRLRAKKFKLKRNISEIKRFDNFLNKNSGIFGEDGKYPTECHIFTGRLNDGYGQFRANGKTVLAHRFAYKLYYGKINNNLTIDHLCRIRSCCNPEHLELVTSRINTLRGNGPAAVNSRKNYCPKKHLLDRKWDNRRYCSTCRKQYHERLRIIKKNKKGS